MTYFLIFFIGIIYDLFSVGSLGKTSLILLLAALLIKETAKYVIVFLSERRLKNLE